MPNRLFWICLMAASTGLADVPARTVPLTIATANLSDNRTQAYEDPAIRILQALQPDILAIQEFNYKAGTSQDLARLLFGPGAHFAREKGGARLPNGIISRYPILAHGQWEDPYIQNRSLFWATVAIPGPRPIHVISVHLVQRNASRRTPQARHLLRLIRDRFPPDDYVVLCGDFNTTSRAAEALAVLTAWFDDSAQPADQDGNPHTNAPRTRPYDFVLPNPALARHHAPTVLDSIVFPDGLVFDTSLWNPPPPPAQWEDTAADMQHLPVMKTFQIPLP
jgi:endonuclease/exonuclease/phosphatase family metal-dependent hydrolase